MTSTGIQISQSLISELPAAERDLGKEAIKDNLWNKSGKKCFLCGRTLNRASDTIHADHDKTRASGSGTTTLANLNLVHKRCNSKKKGHSTSIIRPLLRFEAYLEDSAKRTFAEAVKFPDFNIDTKKSVISRNRSKVRFEFPDGSVENCTVHTEQTYSGKNFEYCFVNAPVTALANDKNVQPRFIKPTQLRKIYLDLLENPLHEPPSCRASAGEGHLLLFDGQHKAIANLLHGREHIVAKVYLEMSRKDATHLVNSIQSKIGKLKLSTLELMYQMDREWHDRVNNFYNSNPAQGYVLISEAN